MRQRSRLVVSGALVAFVLALVVGVAGALDGDRPVQVGWWTSDPSAGSEDEGGFQVAAVAGEPASVAALRFSTPSGVTTATLMLQESGGFVTPASALQVCITTEPWEPANPGSMDDAPTADCTAAAPLERDAEALTWTAEVGTLLPTVGGSPALMIVPGEEPGGGSPLDPGFRVSFSEAALAVVSAPGTTTSTTVAANPGFGGGGGGGGSSPSFSGGPTPTFTSPGPITPTTVAPNPTATVPEEQPTGEAFAPPDFSAGAEPGGGGGADQPWERLLFLVPLSAVAGVAAVYLRRFLTQRGVVEA